MHVDITGRQIEITPALREFTEEKLQKVERLLGTPLECHVVLAIEKHRHMAEIKIKSRTAYLSGAHETGDLYASIAEVVDKLERQALKHKEKMRDHKHRRGPRDPEIAATIASNALPSEGGRRGEDVDELRIVRVPLFSRKPMSPIDAALELESSGKPLLVFRDSGNERVCVVYRESDGLFGLVEPDF